MTRETQIARLVALGYSLPQATQIVNAALAMVPAGADPVTWIPSAEQLDNGVSDADAERARNDWYASAPDRYARILDAGEAPNA